jgi:glycosidase
MFTALLTEGTRSGSARTPIRSCPRRRPGRRFPLALLVASALASPACSARLAGAAEPEVTAAAAAPAAHEWARGAVFYEVFVRSFADSDGDGVGDLRGLTDRLDHLNDGRTGGADLGVDALWLMPVFESPSYHGYDTVDYDRIDREYGTEEDFDRFLAEAHRRGLRVILDLVMNHSSSQHPWFQESATGWGSPKRAWYVWRGDDPGWTQPWGGTNRTWHPHSGAYYYGVFWSGMPDLDYDTPAVREEMIAVAQRWLDRGVDGFRLDATRHLFAEGPGELQNDRPKTHAFLRELSARLRASHPKAILVGENWTTTPIIATYFGSPGAAVPDELPMSFDFPLAEAILGAARDGDASRIAAKLAEIQQLYPPGAIDAPFLTNHDQVRIATQLAGDPGRLRVAAAVLLTLPGAPFLYYGEELGMQNGPQRRDEDKRMPMAWDGSEGGGFTTGTPWHALPPGHATANVAAQRGRPGSLLEHYRGLIALRRRSPALRTGDLVLLSATDRPTPILAFVRRAGKQRVLVLHNLSDAPATSEPLPFRPRQLRRALLPGGRVVPVPGNPRAARVDLPPHGSAAFRM